MPFWPLLLRVLLGVTLLMNGVTSAMASVQMDIQHASQQAQVKASKALIVNAHQSCHDEAATPEKQATKDKTSGGDHGRNSDCCKSSSCRCACLHSAQATVPVWSVPNSVTHHAHSVRPLPLGHAAPPLPHLIRPPIG